MPTSRLPRRGKMLNVYPALIGRIVLTLTIAKGYYAYTHHDPATPFNVNDLISAVLVDDVRVVVYATLGFVYLLPLFIADFRDHHDRVTIGIVNVAFGWTLVGWLLASCWALLPTQGLSAMLANAKKRAAPVIVQANESLGRVRREAELHPLVRDTRRQLDRLLGGRLRRYVPPPEGTESLIAGWNLVRDIEGGIRISARLLLPMNTLLTVRVRRLEEEIFSTRCVLDSDGWLRIGPLANFGRPYPRGRYRFRLETLPFLYGSQEDWILDAVGERGVYLPHSATEAADPEFPQHGRKLDITICSEITEPAPETRLIETVKQYRVKTANGVTTENSVEKLLCRRFAARPGEQPCATPWTVEQLAASQWVVAFAFTRHGRPHYARWAVDAAGAVRFLDPEAKSLSVE